MRVCSSAVAAALALTVLASGCAQAAPSPGPLLTDGPAPSSSPVVRPAPAADVPLPPDVARVLPTAYERLRAAAGADPGKGYPRRASPGAQGWETTPVDDWTSGFFPGALWIAGDLSGDPSWRGLAERWSAPIRGQVTRTDTHDLGFVVDDSLGAEQRATGAEADDVVTAAKSLATRYSPTVHAIKSWDTQGDGDKRESWRYPVIVDNLMNLPLLYHAGALPGGDGQLADVATEHALTASRTNLRPDGSTAHVALFDPDTGAFLGRETWQGAAPDSTWARGQGWAIHGFTDAARASGRPELRDAAVKAADWWLAHVPADGDSAWVPSWDFSKPDEERDTSAAAVAASGLVDLGDLVGGSDGQRYRDAAGATLQALATRYVAPDGPALLAHAVGGKPQGSEVDVGLVYADYYFLEAAKRWRVQS